MNQTGRVYVDVWAVQKPGRNPKIMTNKAEAIGYFLVCGTGSMLSRHRARVELTTGEILERKT